ncbi:MAG: biopolymer transporter ExbD [Bacteroidota bacterium]
MPKIKVPSKSPHIDMTPMVDLFSLLLTFFMLTTTFRPQEAAQIDTPSSISDKQAPDKNIITLLISKDNKVFFNIDNGKDSSTHYRADILKEMGKQFNVTFTQPQIDKFTSGSSFGMPIAKMGTWLNEKDNKKKEQYQVGIPLDSANNRASELWYWIRVSRQQNPAAEVAIKGDGGADYKVVKKIMDVLLDNGVRQFNLTTTLIKEEAVLKN